MRLISLILALFFVGMGGALILGSPTVALNTSPGVGGIALVIGALCILFAAGFAAVGLGRSQSLPPDPIPDFSEIALSLNGSSCYTVTPGRGQSISVNGRPFTTEPTTVYAGDVVVHRIVPDGD